MTKKEFNLCIRRYVKILEIRGVAKILRVSRTIVSEWVNKNNYPKPGIRRLVVNCILIHITTTPMDKLVRELCLK